ncbi:MAG TPA: hypothetical protein VGF56_16865 [Rhizomicrobium sp.]|jgi:hypothetical protein
MVSQVRSNYEAFKKLLPGLLEGKNAGKSALMSNGKIVEFYNDFADAVRAGNAKFGPENFSVQRVTAKKKKLG